MFTVRDHLQQQSTSAHGQHKPYRRCEREREARMLGKSHEGIAGAIVVGSEPHRLRGSSSDDERFEPDGMKYETCTRRPSTGGLSASSPEASNPSYIPELANHPRDTIVELAESYSVV